MSNFTLEDAVEQDKRNQNTNNQATQGGTSGTSEGQSGANIPTFTSFTYGPPPKPSTTYVDIFNKINKHTPETDEQKKARLKKERRQRNWKAVSDGISAIANAWTVASGGGPIWNPANSQLKAHNARIAEEKKEREAKDRQYYQDLLEAHKADNAYNMQQFQIYDSNRQHAFNVNKDNNANLQQKYANERQAGRDKVEDQHWQTKFNEDVRQFGLNHAIQRAQLALSQANAQGEYTAYDRNGKPHKFKDPEAAIAFALQEGTAESYDETTTKEEPVYDMLGKPTGEMKTVTTTKKKYRPGNRFTAEEDK